MTPEKVEELYEELSKFIIELDPDPAARGPGYLQDLIAKTRGYLNRVSFIAQEVYRERHVLERSVDAHETVFQARSDELLAEDHRVTRLPNIDDRKAMINLLLREDRTLISDLKRQLKELGFVEKVVRHRQRELDNTMSSIRMQKSLIDTDLRTGAHYGDTTDTSRGSIYRATDIDENELDRLLRGSYEEETLQVEETVWTAQPQEIVVEEREVHKVEEVEVSKEDNEIAKFLDGDDDYAGLFEGV